MDGRGITAKLVRVDMLRAPCAVCAPRAVLCQLVGGCGGQAGAVHTCHCYAWPAACSGSMDRRWGTVCPQRPVMRLCTAAPHACASYLPALVAPEQAAATTCGLLQTV